MKRLGLEAVHCLQSAYERRVQPALRRRQEIPGVRPTQFPESASHEALFLCLTAESVSHFVPDPKCAMTPKALHAEKEKGAGRRLGLMWSGDGLSRAACPSMVRSLRGWRGRWP